MFFFRVNVMFPIKAKNNILLGVANNFLQTALPNKKIPKNPKSKLLHQIHPPYHPLHPKKLAAKESKVMTPK